MVLSMSRPTTRPNSQNAQFQRRVPAHILKIAKGKHVALVLPSDGADGEPIRKTIKLAPVLRFSLETAKDNKALRDERQGAVLQQLEKAYQAIVEAHGKGPRRLSDKDCHALAGIIYRAFAEGLEENPIGPTLWARIRDENEFAMNGPLPKWSIADTPEQQARLERVAMLNGRFGPFVDAILLREGVICDGDSRDRLLFAFARAMNEAAAKLQRNAEGDYSPDIEVARRYPPWDSKSAKPTKGSKLTFADLLRRWENEGGKAASSKQAFRSAVAAFKLHLKHDDPSRVTKADVRDWKDALLTKGLSAKTINGSYIANVRTLYRLAKRDDLLASDPTEDIRVKSKRKAGTGRLPYTDDEVAAILSLADRESIGYLQWIPWLLALSGARVGEIAQLWSKHVREVDGVHVLCITPTDDEGTIKTASSEREVPIHPALIDRGFLEYVASRSGRPLFYGGRIAKPHVRKSDTSRHPSKGTVSRVREWIRGHGFDNPRKAPSHAFRHWFKTACMKAGVLDSVANHIQGHAGTDGEASGYRHRDLRAMYSAVCKIRVPVVET